MDINSEDAIYKIALTMIPGVGGSGIRRILSSCGSEREFFQNLDEHVASGAIAPALAQNAKKSNVIEQAKSQIEICHKHNINVLYFSDNNYPRKLAACNDSPAILFTLGKPYNFDAMRTVGIVGTRLADSDAQNNIFSIVESLKNDNINAIIISGLAAGADTFAHQAALKFGLPTAAVLGHGLNMVYPAANRKLAGDIVHGDGVLITEYYYGRPVSKTNFACRNRIIAGLCDALIVAQSKISGGALITAENSIDYKKSVFAFPGRASDKLYAGCNLLISRNKATLISNADDLEHSMGWDKNPNSSTAVQTSLNLEPLSADEAKIIDILRTNGQTVIDTISALSGISVSQLSSILLMMEFKDLVKSFPGKRFEANGAMLFTKELMQNLKS